MVTAVKAALEFLIPYYILFGENKVQYSTFPCWLLSHLEEETVIFTFQKPSGLLVHYYVVPLTYIRVV